MELLIPLISVIIASVSASNEGIAPVIREQPSDIVARRNEPATFNCAASGAARITWYRNGEEVVTSSQDPRSHRVLLPSGSLFFLRVTVSRRESDAGTYWCVASNNHGATRSSNATLTVASLGYDFEAPLDPVTKVSVGSSLILPCGPPKGTPAPKVSWLKNGHELSNTSRITVAKNGDLLINNTNQEDIGTYLCRARNSAGTREGPPTELLIMMPPWFEESPSNMTVASGIKVELACKSQGLPTPTVTWRRLDGKMPLGQAMIEGQRLVLDKVEATDSGVYVCEAENEAGISSVRATLVIVDAPVFTQKPQDIQVLVKESSQLSCQIEGDPTPLVLWRLPTQDQSALLVPSQSYGHISVSPDGHTLSLSKLALTDRGSYYCWGVNSGGGVSTKAEVVVVEAFPPPVIGIGPNDITALPGGVASFSCEVVSEASTPSISWWYRPAAHIPARQLVAGSSNSRISFQDNGAIIIKDLQATDAGIYACHVSAETGKIEQEAILRVKVDAVETKPRKLPAPPSKPKVISFNETAVHITWLPNSQVKSYSKQWYEVEYWQKNWDEWRVAETDLTEESCIVVNLTPGETYFFFVRAANDEGSSFPSPWSEPVITHSQERLSLSEEQIRYTKRRLSRPVVTVTNAEVKAADSVHLTWKFMTSLDNNVEGVLVYIIESLKTVKVITVLGSASYSHLGDLKPNTNYTFFLVPFWHGIEGTPSNSVTVSTPEDAPLSAPSDVHVESREDGSSLITWNTLSLQEARGEVIGYQVALSYNGTEETTETVNNPWLEARGLVPGRLYTVRVAAITRVGPGPYSAPVLMNGGAKGILKDHDTTSLITENTSVLYAQPEPEWLVYLLVPLVIVLFLITLLYIRRLRRKPPSSTVPHTPSLYQEPSMYPSQHSVQIYNEKKIWQTTESDKDSSMSSSRLLRTNHLVNEYAEPKIQVSETTEPYATTALLAPESPHLNRGPPWRHQSDDSGVQVNWSAILPPPPKCPPPQDLDLGDPLRSTEPHNIHIIRNVASQRSSVSGSEQYKRPCDSTSEYSYDAYSQMTPTDSQIGFHSYNPVQVCGCVEVDIETNASQAKDSFQKT